MLWSWRLKEKEGSFQNISHTDLPFEINTSLPVNPYTEVWAILYKLLVICDQEYYYF